MRGDANCSEMVLTSLTIVLYSLCYLKGIFKSRTVYYEISSRCMAASCTSNLHKECNNNRHELALKPHRGYNIYITRSN